MITVIHVNTERTWRGGEGQVFSLACGLKAHEIESVIAAPLKSALMDKARAAGLPVLPLRSTGEISFRQLMDLINGAKKFKAELFHVHTSHGLLSAALASRLIAHRMKVVYSRRTDFHLRTGFLKLSLNKYKWGADKILSVSNGIKRVLVYDGIPASLIQTVYSGIDVDAFDPSADGSSVRSEFNIDSNAVVVGMVAALAPHKDPMSFFRAAEIVVSKHPNSIFLLIGAGSEWNEIETARTRSAIADHFVMTGFRCDIPRLLGAIDIFCMSSREEGLCTSILDAMAMAKPVVATRAGGIPEAVAGDETGLLVQVANPEELAGAISILIEDPERRRKMGIAGRHRVEEIFRIQTTVARTAQIYRELLSASR